MRIPIKFNRKALPGWAKRIIPSVADPRDFCGVAGRADSFEDSVSEIKIDGAWKTTRRNRHPITDGLIVSLAADYSNPSILEVGASSGSASIDIIDRLSGVYGLYFVTDRYFSVPYQVRDNVTFFYHPHTKRCIMRGTDYFVIYDDVSGALFPLGSLAEHALSRAPSFDPMLGRSANMLHPEVEARARNDTRIVVREYDLLDPWPLGKLDMIKVANVLNRQYFAEDALTRAIANLRTALAQRGRLLITDSRDVEKISIFSKTSDGDLVLDREVNGGTDVAQFLSRDSKLGR